MQKFLRTGGFAACLVLIAMGVGAIVAGLDGRDQVRTELAREKIVGSQGGQRHQRRQARGRRERQAG